MRHHITGLVGTSLLVMPVACLCAWDATPSSRPHAGNAAEARLDELHDAYTARYEPLYRKERQAWWDAGITGTDEAFERRRQADTQLLELHGNRRTFAKIKSLRDGGRITDPLRKRLLDVMYYSFLPAQGDTELSRKIVALEANAEQVFNTHRSLINGEAHTENDIRKILAESTDSAQVEEAWKAYMEVGAKVDAKLRELERLRNESARQLGFDNFYSMKLATQEINKAELFGLLDELDELTRKPFAELKEKIDAERSARFGISIEELRPWHYGDLFFQEAPTVGRKVNLDDLYEGKDLVALAKTYFAGMGMPVDDILARSDLYEKPGKSPHAYCADMDRTGNIRVFCNLKPDVISMDTLLHELGHGVYDKYIDRNLPFILRKASNAVTTEGVAMMTGAMAKNQEYLIKVVRCDPRQARRVAQAARQFLRTEKLIFSRWTQVMVRFEHRMYSNPDQDLGKLWWSLKKRYQVLNPPENTSRPDYGAKHHVIAAPAYYHSYMMGDLFACQVYHHIAKNVLGVADPRETCFVGQNEVADYMREKIFRPGSFYSWRQLTKRATGEPLTAKYFAQLYVNP